MKLLEFDIDNAEALLQFNAMAEELYKGEKGGYAAQANSIDKKRFLKAYMLLDADKPVARLVLYDAGLVLAGKPVLFFGNFEALDFNNGKDLLIIFIKIITENYDTYSLIGPVNGNTWNPYRVALDEGPILFHGDISSPRFYKDIMEACGFAVLYTYSTQVQTRLEWTKNYTNEEFSIVYFDRSSFASRLEEIYELTMQAFSEAPLFVPVEKEVFIEKYRQQLPSMDTSLVPFAVDRQGHICGYCACYMDFKGGGLVLKTLARRPGRIYAGIGRLLAQEAVRNTVKAGADSMYHALMHESNDSRSLSAYFYGEPCKRYALYILE